MTRVTCALSLAFAALAPTYASAQNDSAYTCVRGAASTETIEVSTTLARDSLTTFRAIDSVLARLGYALDTTVTRPGRWVTRPRFTWPSVTNKEMWHGSEHPGVQVFVTAVGKGKSTRFTAAARILCVLGTPKGDAESGSVPSMLKMLSAVQVAGELDTFLKGKP